MRSLSPSLSSGAIAVHLPRQLQSYRSCISCSEAAAVVPRATHKPITRRRNRLKALGLPRLLHNLPTQKSSGLQSITALCTNTTDVRLVFQPGTRKGGSRTLPLFVRQIVLKRGIVGLLNLCVSET